MGEIFFGESIARTRIIRAPIARSLRHLDVDSYPPLFFSFSLYCLPVGPTQFRSDEMIILLSFFALHFFLFIFECQWSLIDLIFLSDRSLC